MNPFKRGRGKGQPADPKSAVRQELLQALGRTGLGARLQHTPQREAVILANGMEFDTADLYSSTAGAAPERLPELVQRWVADLAAIANGPHPEDMSPAELRQSARTLLLAATKANLEAFPYARKPFDGILQILCLTFGGAAIRLPNGLIGRLALPPEELFAAGQANTEAEPLDPPTRIEELGFTVIAGPSEFTSSKVANMDSLVPELTGPAQQGVMFSIPTNHAINLAVVGPGWEQTLDYLAVTTLMAFEQAEEADDVLTYFVYYWAPDGAVNLLSWPTRDDAGQPVVKTSPPESFSRYVTGEPPPPR